MSGSITEGCRSEGSKLTAGPGHPSSLDPGLSALVMLLRGATKEERRQRVMAITEFDAGDPEAMMHAMADKILKYRRAGITLIEVGSGREFFAGLDGQFRPARRGETAVAAVSRDLHSNRLPER
jgi:hypothetical protein